MKKLLFIFIATILVSCSAEELSVDTNCDCIEVEEYTEALSGHYQNAIWIETGVIRATDLGCNQNGYAHEPHVSSGNCNNCVNGIYHYKRWRVKCE